MNKFEWRVLLWGFPVVVALALFGDYMYTKGKEDANAESQRFVQEMIDLCQVDLP